jgi:hypothetical protein
MGKCGHNGALGLGHGSGRRGGTAIYRPAWLARGRRWQRSGSFNGIEFGRPGSVDPGTLPLALRFRWSGPGKPGARANTARRKTGPRDAGGRVGSLTGCTLQSTDGTTELLSSRRRGHPRTPATACAAPHLHLRESRRILYHPCQKKTNIFFRNGTRPACGSPCLQNPEHNFRNRVAWPPLSLGGHASFTKTYPPKAVDMHPGRSP